MTSSARPRELPTRSASRHVVRDGGQRVDLGTMFVTLDPFEQRRTPELRADAIVAKLHGAVLAAGGRGQGDRGRASAGPWSGHCGGLSDDGRRPRQRRLEKSSGGTDNLVRQGNEKVAGPGEPQHGFSGHTPQLYVDIDRTKCKTMGVPLSDVFDALQVEMGGLYVNDFNQFGRTFQVNAQAESRSA